MPKALINGVNLYYEVHGEGYPLVWCHEFAGDYRSWETQVRFFTRRYQVVTYNARGYPPSDVPSDLDAYSQEQAVEDLDGLLRHLGIEQAHIGGLSMGGNVALNFGLTYPQKAKTLIVAGTGTGSTDPDAFRKRAGEFADQMEAGGMQAMAGYTGGPARVQLLRKDPRGWKEFADQFFEHSPLGSALTFRSTAPTAAGPDADPGRRRGRPMHRAWRLHEALSPELGPGLFPPVGPCHQPGRAGPFQPGSPGLPHGRGVRQVG